MIIVLDVKTQRDFLAYPKVGWTTLDIEGVYYISNSTLDRANQKKFDKSFHDKYVNPL